MAMVAAITRSKIALATRERSSVFSSLSEEDRALDRLSRRRKTLSRVDVNVGAPSFVNE